MPKSPTHGMGRVLGQRGKTISDSIRALHAMEVKGRETAKDKALEMYTSVSQCFLDAVYHLLYMKKIRRELDRTILATIKGHLLGTLLYANFCAQELKLLNRRHFFPCQ